MEARSINMLLSAKDIALRLNCALRTAYKLIGTEIRVVMVGKLKRVTEADLAAYIARGGSGCQSKKTGADNTRYSSWSKEQEFIDAARQVRQKSKRNGSKPRSVKKDSASANSAKVLTFPSAKQSRGI